MTPKLFQDRPDRAGFPRYTIDLASPELPCGAAWLANCLIELGIPAWKPWSADDTAHWVALGEDRYRHRLRGSPWSRVLPALVDGRVHEFRAGRAVRVHHVWPRVYEQADHSVLMVRDPRDALVSAWHRQRRLGTVPAERDFLAFCLERYHHYPISRLDFVVLFLRVWRRALVESGGHVVRFEDYRTDARATLAAVLGRIGIDAAPRDVERAVEASSLAKIRAAEATMIADGVVEVPIVRGVPPGEYERVFDDPAFDAVAARLGEACRWLGYPGASVCDSEPRAGFRAIAPADVLGAIRKAGVPAGDDDWLAHAVSLECRDIARVDG